MNLKDLSKQVLLSETERLVREERRITSAVLWHLHEIERRRLYAELGFSSLFEYCTQYLKYSSGSAQRRIASMRLLRELPEIESKISSGVLNVSALSQAQSVFRQARLKKAPFTLEAKKRLVEKLENKSQRECEKILSALAPSVARPSRERVVAPTRTEFRFEADDELYSQIKRMRAHYAHKLNGSKDFADLLKLLITEVVADVLPALEVDAVENVPAEVPATRSTRSRYVPKPIKLHALQTAQGQCTYTDPETGRRCASRFALQYDHIKPLALGGRTEPSNLRVLCRAHNQWAAVQSFGVRKMERYL